MQWYCLAFKSKIHEEYLTAVSLAIIHPEGGVCRKLADDSLCYFDSTGKGRERERESKRILRNGMMLD